MMSPQLLPPLVVLALAIGLAGCQSTDKRPVTPIQFGNQVGVYVPLVPIALREKLPITVFPMMRSFDAYNDVSGKAIIDIGTVVSAQSEAASLTRTTDVVAYTTIKVTDSPTRHVFALIGYGARGAFSVTAAKGKLTYLTSSGEASSNSEVSDIFQMGEGGVLASILLPDEAVTAENFKKSTRTMLKAIQTQQGASVTPVLLGAILYTTDPAVDPDAVAVEILQSDLIKKILFSIGDQAELMNALQ